MKTKTILVLMMMLVLTVSANYSQQEFTFTTTAANITASRARIDKIGLANNPNAIIVATPLYDPIKTTQRSLGVWFYNNQWYFFNTDHSLMKEGLSFKMQIFLSPSDNEFLHIISTQNLDGGFSVINHPLTNNNPNAGVKILQNYAPDIRTPYKLNADEAQAIYDAPTGKWYIQNVNGTALSTYTAYNVVVTSSATRINPNTRIENAISKNPNAILPTQTTTNTGNAGGNPVEPLKFNPTLGKKIILYPGQTGDVGFSVRGNLLQIHADNPNADVAIGYEQAGTFNEKFRVKANGAIAVSGDSGQTGQVLTSNGANSPPTWQQPSSTGTVSSAATPKAYIGFLTNQYTTDQYTWASSVGSDQSLLTGPKIPRLSVQIKVTQLSMVSVSAFISTQTTFNCGLGGCTAFGRGINLFRDLNRLIYLKTSENNAYYQFVIPNYTELLDPGTYTYTIIPMRDFSQFSILFFGTETLTPSYISVQVFPQ